VDILFIFTYIFTDAIWDRKATLAAISLYEANINMMDHHKKKGKIWEAIRIGLLDFRIEVLFC